MAWSTGRSRRDTEMPHNWDQIRRGILQRDNHQCTIRGPHCTTHANQVDHIGDRHNHQPTNLRAACQRCHAERTSHQGNQAANAQRATATHPRQQHPGMK